MEGRNYWLKLKRDFFKRHDIRIVENMPGGKDYILFYLTLLCESIDHDGNLRFSETIPYDDGMLSVITNTSVEVVRGAIKVFSELGMIECLDDGTLFMREVQKMVGSQSATPNAERMRRYYEKQKGISKPFQNEMPTISKQNESKSIDIDKDIEKDKEIEKEKVKRFVPPTLEEVEAYARERNSSVDPKQFYEYFSTGNWVDAKGNKVKNWKQKFLTWEKFNVKTAPKRGSLNNFSTESDTDTEEFVTNSMQKLYEKYGGD